MANAAVESVDAAVAELAGDALLRAAVKSKSKYETLINSRSAVIAYEAALAVADESHSQHISGKLSAARKLEYTSRECLVRKDTDAAFAQYVMAYPKSRRSRGLIGLIRANHEPGEFRLSDVVELEVNMGPVIEQVVAMGNMVNDGVAAIDKYILFAQQLGGLPQSDFFNYVGVVRETAAKADALMEKYDYLRQHEPTAAALLKQRVTINDKELALVKDLALGLRNF